jgi:2-succinyl-5-enolpyruvyl-6-hydroxy-3-cyclohexene-1-carboxylate synthase
VNLPFEEPLTPAGEDVSAGDPQPVPEPAPLPPHVSGDDIERLSMLLSSTERGVLVVGSSPTAPTSLVAVADAAGWPVIAEPTSGARTRGVLAAGQALLGHRAFGEHAEPTLVVQAGAAPTSRATQAFVASAGELAVVDALHLDPDPEERASIHLAADPETLGSSIERSVRREASPWRDVWRDADARARAGLDEFLDSVNDPFEPRIARDVAAWLPAGATLFVGNSTPIRDLDLAMAPRDGIRVRANRGASGIDGLVSTAMGLAVATPTVALLGDLSLLYDAGALLWAGGAGLDLVLVIVRNGGGEIFSLLPQRELPEHRALFTTPHAVDLAALCAAARVGHARIDQAAALTPALDEAARSGGVRVVEVVVDPSQALKLREELRDAVDRSLR